MKVLSSCCWRGGEEWGSIRNEEIKAAFLSVCYGAEGGIIYRERDRLGGSNMIVFERPNIAKVEISII